MKEVTLNPRQELQVCRLLMYHPDKDINRVVWETSAKVGKIDIMSILDQLWQIELAENCWEKAISMHSIRILEETKVMCKLLESRGFVVTLPTIPAEWHSKQE